MSSDEEKEFNILFKYYEKAIEGRNFHYQNYNTWANYYSIFTGALFIAFYTLEHEKFLFLKILIMLVGLVTSICWNLTVKGHYHWMLSSPARIFRFYPARFFRFSAKKLFEANGSDFQASLHTVGISL